MPIDCRDAAALPPAARPKLTRNLPRRLELLEIRAKEVAASTPEPHTICFVNMEKRVVNEITWENGKQVWKHYDPPRDRAEFGPMV
jgi:hypothetical protein